MAIFRRIFGGKERRQFARHAGTSLTVQVEGHKYKTLDWSLGGFRLPSFHHPIQPKERFSGRLTPARGGTPGEFTAEVVWVKEDGHCGVKLIEITPATFLSMASLKAC